MYIYIYVYIYRLYTQIYKERERERERVTNTRWPCELFKRLLLIFINVHQNKGSNIFDNQKILIKTSVKACRSII